MTIVALHKSVSQLYCICVLLPKSAQNGKLIGAPLHNEAVRCKCTAQANLLQRSAIKVICWSSGCVQPDSVMIQRLVWAERSKPGTVKLSDVKVVSQPQTFKP